MTSFISLINSNSQDGLSRPPVHTAVTLADKEALAEWIVKTSFRNGSSVLQAALEREADFRFCSLLSRCICKYIFGPTGMRLLDRVVDLVESMGYRLEVQKSGRLADTRARGNMSTPVKYRGFGSTLNNPDHRGHLFQINRYSFIDDAPIIGVLESPETDSAYPTKGMREIGRNGIWRLFRLEPELSDDMTALMIKPEKGDVQMEFAYFRTVDDPNPETIYRVNTAR